MVCLKGRLHKFLAFLLALCLICVHLPVLAEENISASQPYWDYYTLQSYNSDHSESLGRGNWYVTENLSSFSEVSIKECSFGDETLRSLKLTVSAEDTATLGSLMFLNLLKSELLSEADGMRFHISNPSVDTVRIGFTYCDTNAIYSCHKNGNYYVETKDAFYKNAPNNQWNSFCENGAEDVGIVEIPAGFAGYIYLPFASTTRAGQKSSFSRVRLFVGAYADTTQSLYIESIGYYSSAVDFSNAKTVDYGFDVFTELPATNAYPTTNSEYVSIGFSTDVRDGAQGRSLKTVFQSTTSSSGYVQWRINSLWGALYDSSAYGMRFWLKNPQNTDIEIRIQFGDGYKPCRIGAVYYLTDSQGKTVRHTTYKASNESIGCITIPACFEGYIYLPYSLSTTGEISGHLILSPKPSEQITLYFDSFSAFSSQEFKNIVWYVLNSEITVGPTHSDSISYNLNMLDTAPPTQGQWISVKNPNSFAVPLRIDGSPTGCYLAYKDGTVEYVTVDNNTVNIPPDFEGDLYIPFADSQQSLYGITPKNTTQSGSFTICNVGVYVNDIYPDGDANGDGGFNILDLVRLKKYFADNRIYVSQYADINSDNRISIVDMTFLKTGLLFGMIYVKGMDTEQEIIEPDSISVYTSLYYDGAPIIAEENVLDYGADSTGATDSTIAFKQALLAAEQGGGGTVYVPEGRYILTDTVKVPDGVTLYGQWQSPEDAGVGTRGSVILATGNNFLDSSVFELEKSSGIIGITLVFPEQNAVSPLQYDFAVRVVGSRCYTLENFTVVGAWNGVELGSVTQSCQLYYLKNVYISALNIGISNDRTSDIGRLENVNISPEYWCENTLVPLSVNEIYNIFDYCRKNSRGIEFYLNDWSYALDITVKYMKTGLYFGISDSGIGSNGKFYGVDIVNCDTGIFIDQTKIGGVDFTNLSITAEQGSTAAIDTGSNYGGTCMFYNTEISGDFAYPVRNNGASQVPISGTLEFLSGSIGGYGENAWGVTVNGGSVTLQDIHFASALRHIKTSDKIQSLSVLGCTFDGDFKTDIPTTSAENCNIDHTTVNSYAVYELNLQQTVHKPAESTVVCVTDYGAHPSLLDNTAAFTKALDALRGIGGTVYVPAGNWRFEGEITIPTGVKLRGSSAVQFMQNAEHRSGTVLWCFSPSDENGTPFITLEENSGVSGFAVFYEEQNHNTTPYPYSIKAAGKNCYAVNITLTNSYNGLDFASCDTSGYYISGVNGAPVGCGISVGGGAKNGVLKDCHFNPNFSYILTTNKASLSDRLYNATAFRFGDISDGFVYGLFAYGYKNGIHFVSNGAGGAENATLVNCGIDGSETSVRVEDARSVDIVGGQFVAMESVNDKHCLLTEENFKGTIKFYNSNLWGPTDYIIKLCAGNTQFHLVNLCTGYGDYSLYMTGGNALFSAVCFHNRKITVSGSNTSAEFFGCFTRGYKTIIAPESLAGAAVTLNNNFWA